VAQLAAPLPLRPALMGNLVPQSINIWMGAAREGARPRGGLVPACLPACLFVCMPAFLSACLSFPPHQTPHRWGHACLTGDPPAFPPPPPPNAGSSSGLHHDFHDNLYVLLRGRKRFRLWAPQQARAMYTHGALRKVHANGRIVYQGQGQVLADGSEAADVAAWRKRSAAEAAVQRCEAQLEAAAAGREVLEGGRRLTEQVGRRGGRPPAPPCPAGAQRSPPCPARARLNPWPSPPQPLPHRRQSRGTLTQPPPPPPQPPPPPPAAAGGAPAAGQR
jgi:hypothetical protein